ncbi:MAG: CpsD/CapB family tyrosine-protein kinase [Myxococcota bacterium]
MAPDARAATPGEPARALERPQPTDPAIPLEDGPALEACRQIALEVRAQLEARRASSLAVVSAVRDEGKTTTSCNLALALASLAPGREVALLDLDLRRPSIAKVLGLQVGHGLEDVLADEVDLDSARVQFDEPPLDVFPTLHAQRAAHQALTRSRLARLLDELERRYSIVVVDTPPTLLVPDSRLILERVAVCLPVARAGISRVRAFRQMLEVLPQGQVLSTVLNGVKPDPQYYQGYDYGSPQDGGSGGGKRGKRGRA